MNLEIAPAKPGELHAVLSVLDEAAAWLHARGITEQWPPSFSADAEWTEVYRELIGQDEVILGKLAGRPVTTMVLEQQPFHGDIYSAWRDGAVDAVVLSKLAVRRDVAGLGAGAEMLAWAGGHARRLGKSELRLDCWAGNERLKRYYRDAGFESRGEIEMTDREREYSISLFALRVS